VSKRISEIIKDCDKPFAWGTNDCCTLMAAAVKAKSGRDVLKGFRGYRTKLGAAKKLREKGKGTLVKAMIDWLGDPIPIAKARPGDIVMHDSWHVGICQGRYSAMVGENGIELVRTLDCVRAFRNG